MQWMEENICKIVWRFKIINRNIKVTASQCCSWRTESSYQALHVLNCELLWPVTKQADFYNVDLI